MLNHYDAQRVEAFRVGDAISKMDGAKDVDSFLCDLMSRFPSLAMPCDRLTISALQV